MHLHCYMITLAQNAEDAKSNASCWIEEHDGREFYDYGGLEEGEEVVLLDEIRDGLSRTKTDEINRLLPEIEGEIQRYKESGNRSMEGYSHVRYGEVLRESFCSDMPFFNIEEWDWSLPAEVPNYAKGCKWYAVRADLHC